MTNVKNNQKNNKTKKRFVAVLDILGFKNKLNTIGLNQISLYYRRLLEKLTLGCVQSETLSIRFFSDTILLFSEPIDRYGVINDYLFVKAFDQMQNTCAAIMSIAVNQDLPLRGGIAFGDTYIVASKNIYLGQPMIDAHLIEEAQEWIGVAFHESCFSEYDHLPTSDDLPKMTGDNSLLLKEGLCRVIRWDVPVKPESNIHKLLWALNWMQGVKASLYANLERYINSPFESKWNNTIKYFQYLQQVFPGLEAEEDETRRIWGPKYHAF